MPVALTVRVRTAQGGACTGERSIVPADHLHPGSIEPIADGRADPRALIRAANRTTIAALIDGVICNESFLALIGEAATGKTTLASALREELASLSVRALQIGKGECGEISARQIVVEVLGGPQAGLTSADVQSFIEVMTRREEPAQRFVLIIDDAEYLQADALSCLRLLGLTRSVAVQVVFIGRPQFWRVLGHSDGAEGNGLIRRHWELAEPPGRVNRTRDRYQLATERRDDDASADAPAPVNAEAKPDEREETAQPVAKPPRKRRSVGLITSAAVVIFVISSVIPRQAPLRFADDHPNGTGKLARWVRGDQPSFDRIGVTALATAQGTSADPQFMRGQPEVADTAAADAKLETIQPSAGGTLPALSSAGDDPRVLPDVVQAAVQAPSANPSDGVGRLLLAASAAPAAEEPLLEQADDAARFDITQPAEHPSVAVSTEVTAPQPPADAAHAVPQESGSREPPASVAQPAAATAAEAPPEHADGARQASGGTAEPPAATAPPPASASNDATPSQPADTAPVVAEKTRTAEPLAATEPAATASTEKAVPEPAAGTAPTVAEESKAPEPSLAGEPPHSDAIETNAPQPSAETSPALAQEAKTPPPAVEQPPADASVERTLPQPSPPEAAPVVAQTSGAPSPPAVVAASPSTIAPTGITTDKGQAGRAVSSRLQSPPDAGPPLDLTLLLSRADAMLELGDISAARRLYERAAALGNARAATAAGKTYDASFLASIRARGIVPDQAAAGEWYRKAAALGDREAADRLVKLTPRN